MPNKFVTGFTFLVGILFVVSGMTSADFDFSKLTLLTALTTIGGIILTLISIASFFKLKAK